MPQGKLAIAGVVFIVIVILALGSLFTVRVTEQKLVLQLGQWKRTVQEPGLHVKWPWPFQNTVSFERRVLSVDPDAEEVLLNDQKRILVDAFARYRITDPLKFFQTVRNENTFANRFGNILTSTVKEVVAQRSLEDMLSENRNVVMEAIRDSVANDTAGFGIEVVDIRIGRTELPETVSETVYNRMRTGREREANLLRGLESSVRRRSRLRRVCLQ